MATPITIPVDIHLISLGVEEEKIVERPVRVGRETRIQRERVTRVRQIPLRRGEADVRAAFTIANTIWAPADIGFQVGTISPESAVIPGGAEVVDDSGFGYLARLFGPGNAVSLLVVNGFAGTEGGSAVAEWRTCIVGAWSNPYLGTVLAHELGHLLSLEHIQDSWNVMHPALHADNRLTPRQIRQARGSALARRVSGPP